MAKGYWLMAKGSFSSEKLPFLLGKNDQKRFKKLFSLVYIKNKL